MIQAVNESLSCLQSFTFLMIQMIEMPRFIKYSSDFFRALPDPYVFTYQNIKTPSTVNKGQFSLFLLQLVEIRTSDYLSNHENGEGGNFHQGTGLVYDEKRRKRENQTRKLLSRAGDKYDPKLNEMRYKIFGCMSLNRVCCC